VRGIDLAVRPYPRTLGRPQVYAHRGASAHAPENTVEAFELAAREGADGVELDVMCCGSGEVVVVHDAWLERLANRPVCVLTTPLERLRKIDVARHFTAWRKPGQIPTLDEVLEALPSLGVNIELKEDRLGDAGLARKVAKILRAQRAEERVVVSSFNALELLRMRACSPRLPLGYLFEAGQPLYARSGIAAPLLFAQAVHPEHVLLSEGRVRAWHAAGFAVATWTVDDPIRARQLASFGVDHLITNQPRRILQALASGTPFSSARG
jgi:glycerophosphoryl diester phosphodiesterase